MRRLRSESAISASSASRMSAACERRRSSAKRRKPSACSSVMEICVRIIPHMITECVMLLSSTPHRAFPLRLTPSWAQSSMESNEARAVPRTRLDPSTDAARRATRTSIGTDTAQRDLWRPDPQRPQEQRTVLAIWAPSFASRPQAIEIFGAQIGRPVETSPRAAFWARPANHRGAGRVPSNGWQSRH